MSIVKKVMACFWLRKNVDFDQANKETNTSPGQKNPIPTIIILQHMWEINSNFLRGISSNSWEAYTEHPYNLLCFGYHKEGEFEWGNLNHNPFQIFDQSKIQHNQTNIEDITQQVILIIKPTSKPLIFWGYQTSHTECKRKGFKT